MILAISTKALGNIQGDVRIGLVKFRSSADAWTTHSYGFTRNIITLEEWLISDQPIGGSQDEHEAVGKKNKFQLRAKGLFLFFPYHHHDRLSKHVLLACMCAYTTD